MGIKTKAELTCPECGFVQVAEMPTEACQFFYECVNCKVALRPRAGDCCVFCSYANLPCPPKQLERGKTSIKEVMKIKVEFFSAECRLCERTLDILKYNFPALEIDVHRASECKDGSCCALAEQYGVQAVPSLVVDGKVALVGLPDEHDIKSLATILPR